MQTQRDISFYLKALYSSQRIDLACYERPCFHLQIHRSLLWLYRTKGANFMTFATLTAASTRFQAKMELVVLGSMDQELVCSVTKGINDWSSTIFRFRGKILEMEFCVWLALISATKTLGGIHVALLVLRTNWSSVQRMITACLFGYCRILKDKNALLIGHFTLSLVMEKPSIVSAITARSLPLFPVTMMES